MENLTPEEILAIKDMADWKIALGKRPPSNIKPEKYAPLEEPTNTFQSRPNTRYTSYRSTSNVVAKPNMTEKGGRRKRKRRSTKKHRRHMKK